MRILKYLVSIIALIVSIQLSWGQIIVGPYTGIDHATNFTNPQTGGACAGMPGINLSIGDDDFVNGAAEVPLGWQFSGTWDSGLSYFDGPGSELLLVSLHTYTESWWVALRLSNGTTTAFQTFNLTIVTSNAVGSLNHCGGIVFGFNYERPSQELDFATYAIPVGVGVIGILFEPFSDGAVNPDPHGVMVLDGTLANVPCDTTITIASTICQGDSLLFESNYYSSTGIYTDSLLTALGCDSIMVLDLTVNPIYTVNQIQSICQGESILLGGSFQTTVGVYTDSLLTVLNCDSLILTTLTVNPTYTVNQTQTICQGDSILLGGAYQSAPGVYTDSYLTVLLCDSIILTTLSVNPVYAINQAITICQTDSVLLGGAYQNTSGIYTDSLLTVLNCDSLIITTLTVNNGYTVNQSPTICQGDSLLLSGAYQNTSGIYTDSLVTLSGCDSVIISTLTVNPTYSINQTLSICQGDSMLLGGSYQFISGIYYDSLQTILSCDSIIITDLTVLALPLIEAGVDQVVCVGQSVVLNGSGSPILLWDNGIDNVPFIPVLGTTMYTLTGTAVNGCSATDSLYVTANSVPIVDAGPDYLICEGENITLTGTGAVSYVWSNGVIDGQSFTPPVGVNVYTVIGSDGIGCFSIDSVEVVVDAVPSITISADVLNGCSPLTVIFTNETLGNLTDCLWTFGNGETISGCGSVTTTFDQTGYFDVTLAVSAVGGCFVESTFTDYIYVEPDPVASFTTSPDEITMLKPEVFFDNNSQGAVSYQWDFGDNSSFSNEVNPTHNYEQWISAGYIVELIAYSELGCTDTAYQTVIIEEELLFFIPNSFTPDGDEHNQTFRPVFYSGIDPYSYELHIFNRWGEIIFTSMDTDFGWDGHCLSGYCQDGIYTWTIEFKIRSNDERKSIQGHVNLIR